MLLALAGACTPLDPIDPDICGNHVVEPLTEDCDGEAMCGAPTAGAAACRYLCGGDAGLACPVGFGCGLDGICRQPSGGFAVIDEEGAAVLSVQTADLDGDGRVDVFRTSPDETSAQFFDASFALAATTTIPRDPGDVSALLSTLVFDEAGMPGNQIDVAVALDLGDNHSGLTVYQTQTDRSLTPTAYPTLNIMGADRIFGVALNAVSPANQDEVIAFAGGAANGSGVMLGINNGDPTPHFFALTSKPLNPRDLTGTATGRLIQTLSPCDELVWTAASAGPANRNKLYLFQPCKPMGDEDVGWNDVDDVLEIELARDLLIQSKPSGVDDQVSSYYSNVFVLDMDGDGDDDIAVLLKDGPANDGFDNGRPVFFLENESNLPLWTWSDAVLKQVKLVAPDVASADGNTKVVLLRCEDYIDPKLPEEVRGTGAILDIVDLNHDGTIDYITDDSIWVSRPVVDPMGAKTYDQVESCLEWGQAVVADFDRDGDLDVAASRLEEAGVDVALGAGDGAFTWNALSTQREVSYLSAGDYDGDSVTDLAFLEIDFSADPAVDGPTDRLFVAFGSTSGGFGKPQQLGTLRRARAIVSGRVQGSDATDDILVSATNVKGDLAVAAFLGDGARQLVAPYLLQFSAGASVPQITALTAGLFGEGAIPKGIAALTFRRPSMAGGMPTTHLWGLDVDGDAELAGSDKAAIPLDFCDSCVPVALDLDQDGIDELVLLGSEDGRIYQRGAGANQPFEEVGEIAGLDGLCFSTVPYDQSHGPNQAFLRDLDLDGLLDIGIMAQRCDKMPPTAEVVILWNDGSGSLGGDRATRMPVENDMFSFPSVGAINLDSDPEPELLVCVLPPGGRANEGSPGEYRSFDLDREVSTLVFEDGALLVTEDGEPLLGATSQAAGDFNGDGVEDLVLASYDFFAVLQGVPVR